MVSHIYVGRYISEKRRATHMVRYGRQAVRDPKGLDNNRQKVCYRSRLKYCFIGSAQEDESHRTRYCVSYSIAFLNIN